MNAKVIVVNKTNKQISYVDGHDLAWIVTVYAKHNIEWASNISNEVAVRVQMLIASI